MTFTKEQLTRIIESADDVITALAGTNEDCHRESDDMIRLWDHLNDVAAPPAIVRKLAEMALANYHPAPTATVTGVDDDVRNVVALLENNEWAEHCTKTVLGSRLETEITRLVGSVRPAPVAIVDSPDIPAVEPNWNDPTLREPGIWAYGFLEGQKAILSNAQPVPATGNTAQQFEALATSQHGSCDSCGGTGDGTKYTAGECPQCMGSGGGNTSSQIDARRRRNRQSNSRARAKETQEQANQRRAANRDRMRKARGGKQ